MISRIGIVNTGIGMALLDSLRRLELEREQLAAEVNAWKRIAAARASALVLLRQSGRGQLSLEHGAG